MFSLPQQIPRRKRRQSEKPAAPSSPCGPVLRARRPTYPLCFQYVTAGGAEPHNSLSSPPTLALTPHTSNLPFAEAARLANHVLRDMRSDTLHLKPDTCAHDRKFIRRGRGGLCPPAENSCGARVRARIYLSRRSRSGSVPNRTRLEVIAGLQPLRPQGLKAVEEGPALRRD